jgi:hypothetical protein
MRLLPEKLVLPGKTSRPMIFTMTVHPDKIQVGAGADLVQRFIRRLTERELDLIIRWGNLEFNTGFFAGKFLDDDTPMVCISNAAGALHRGEVTVTCD